MNDINDILKIIMGLQGVIIIAFIIQIIANLTIIFQLPKIKKICEDICYEEDNEDKTETP